MLRGYFRNDFYLRHDILEVLYNHWHFDEKEKHSFDDLWLSYLKIRDRLRFRYSKKRLGEELNKLTVLKYIESGFSPKGNSRYVYYRLLSKGETTYIEKEILAKAKEVSQGCQKSFFWVTGGALALITIIGLICSMLK